MAKVTENIKNTYLTLYEIVEKYQKKNESANVGAMKHVKGSYAAEMIVPVRKKTGYQYISRYFFYEILGIHENFIKDHVNSKELPTYILGKVGSTNYRYVFDKLEKCYHSDSEYKEVPLTVLVKEKKKNNDGGDRQGEKVSEERKCWEEELTYTIVNLNRTYILELISQALIKSMREFWQSVKHPEKAKNGKQKTDIYRDLHVCLVVYEIFLREFSKQMEEQYEEYTRLLEQMQESLDELNSQELTGEMAENIFTYYSSIDTDRYSEVEEVNRHIVFYTAVLKSVVMIELINLQNFLENDKKFFVVVKRDFNVEFLFEKNGNNKIETKVKAVIKKVM